MPVDAWTTSVLNTVKMHMWAGVKTVLVNRRLVSSLWVEDELFTSVAVPADWPDVNNLVFSDEVIRK